MTMEDKIRRIAEGATAAATTAGLYHQTFRPSMRRSSRHIKPTAGEKQEQVQLVTPFSTAMAVALTAVAAVEQQEHRTLCMANSN
jgi:hypothetical protein